MTNKFTTIALHPEDKERLDATNERIFDGSASYREVVVELIEREEEQHESMDDFIATLFEEVDESRAKVALSRAWGDREMVKELNSEDTS